MDLPAYLDESIVQQKHHGCQIPGPLLAPEKHLSNVADILYLGMSEAEFPRGNISGGRLRAEPGTENEPDGQGRVEHKGGDDDG